MQHAIMVNCLGEPNKNNLCYIRLDLPYSGQQVYPSSHHGFVVYADLS